MPSQGEEVTTNTFNHFGVAALIAVLVEQINVLRVAASLPTITFDQAIAKLEEKRIEIENEVPQT